MAVPWWLEVAGLPAASAAVAEQTPVLSYRVIGEYPHASDRFTQGLAIRDNRIFESSGGYGSSRIYIDELRSRRPVTNRRLPSFVFGEGLALVGERVFALTWREGLAFELDTDLGEVRRIKISGEGWGLANFPYQGLTRLIQSDGSSTLKILDPSSFKLLSSISVKEQDQSVNRLNELEVANGWIYANVWLTSKIAVIEPREGQVKAWLDLTALYPAAVSRDPDAVLNGIAFDARTGHFFVTGKRWPTLFEIEVDSQALFPAK